jgi:DNA-binding MarR family transcriptional regulator
MPSSPSRYRLTHIQHFVLDVLRCNPQISYDGMAEQAEIDRQTTMQAIRRLTRSYRVIKLDGRGRLPNRYLPSERR